MAFCLFCKGRRRSGLPAQYVALGSSFAAGLGLGRRAAGSPFPCQRTSGGYPQLLAGMTGLSLVDMTCSGATARHVLRGGQFFQGPQLDAIDATTELVTLTVGGNDVGYVGDLILLAYKRRGGLPGSLLGLMWKGARPLDARKFGVLHDDIKAILNESAQRAPRARIVVATYPVILPPRNVCAEIGITESNATLMRDVGERLADITRNAAVKAGVTLVDMAALSSGHDACAAEPWVNGFKPAKGAPFHPTSAGAEATARQIRVQLGL